MMSWSKVISNDTIQRKFETALRVSLTQYPVLIFLHMKIIRLYGFSCCKDVLFHTKRVLIDDMIAVDLPQSI